MRRADHPPRSRSPIRPAVLAILALLLLLAVAPGTARAQCDPEVEVEILDAPPVVEGAGEPARFEVRLIHPAGGVSGSPPPCDVSVEMTTLGGGTAVAGADYDATTRQATLGPNQRQTVLSVTIRDDGVPEPPEDFFVGLRLLGDLQGPRLRRATARGVILDDGDERDRGGDEEKELPPDDLEVVGEAEPGAVVGETVPLRVRVLRGDGTPAPGARVEWRVTGGDALLVGADGDPRTTSSTVTADDGRTGVSLELVGRPGVVRVVASLPGNGASVAFTVDAAGDLGDLIPERPSGAASVAGVLDELCRDAAGEMGALCEYLFGLSDDEQRAVVIAATPRQAAAAGNQGIHAGHNQADGLRDRLRDRRAAAAGENGGGAASSSSGTPTGAATDRLAALSMTGLGGFAAPAATTARYADAEAWSEERVARAVAAAMAQVEGEAEGEAEGEKAAPAPALPAEPASDSPAGLYVSGRVSRGDRYTTFDEAGFDLDVLGLTVGADTLVGGRAVLGLALGYLEHDAAFYENRGDLQGESLSLAAYATAFSDHAYAELVLTGARNDLTQSRGIDLPVPFQGASRYRAVADLEGDQWGATATLGADRSFGAANLEGYLRGSWLEASFDGYEEQGAGPFDLVIGDQDVESLLVETGVQVTWAVSYSWGVLQPHLRASYLRELEEDSRLIRGRFVEDVQALEFVVPTETRDEEFGNAGAGFTATLAGGRSLYLLYDRDISRDGLEMETLSFGLRFEL